MTLYLATTATHRCLVEADTPELAVAYAEQALNDYGHFNHEPSVVLTVEEVTLPHILPN